jgi:hypothetical protein
MQIALGNTLFASTDTNPVTGEHSLGAMPPWLFNTTGAVAVTAQPTAHYGPASGCITPRLSTRASLRPSSTPSNSPPDSYPVVPGNTSRSVAKYFGLIDTQCATPVDLSQLATRNDTMLGPESQRWRSILIAGNLTDTNATQLLPADLLERGCPSVMDGNVAERLREELILKIGEDATLSAQTRGFTSLANYTVPSNPWMATLGASPTLVNYYALTGSNLMQSVYNYGDSSFDVVDEVMGQHIRVAHALRARRANALLGTGRRRRLERRDVPRGALGVAGLPGDRDDVRAGLL